MERNRPAHSKCDIPKYHTPSDLLPVGEFGQLRYRLPSRDGYGGGTVNAPYRSIHRL
ncbi:hypothetical protein FIBSPDRAFT_877970 [Athelia psychrophila]|uniref:Uncharacterized protein n=1 Tax=Athelia psychrophila TaxID=1759441 RepID=A0A167VHI9_9AGAM|nr:hypothetical protein FIBSPDRAFT_877970 [Fibularhizoctonia sp. CBS 109695]